MSYCSKASSSDDDQSGSSDDDEQGGRQTTRKFELSRKIDKSFQHMPDCGGDGGGTGGVGEWSFLLDDGMFERQANFRTTSDLWRHLEKIDCTMTKLRTRSKKGSVRLFKAEYGALLAVAAPGCSKARWEGTEALTELGGKWVVRFSRKFSQDLSDVWVDLVLKCVAEQLPRSEVVMGCCFNTRKGKTEMEVWTKSDPMEAPAGGKGMGKEGQQMQSEQEQQLLIRELLMVAPDDKTIQIQYKSHDSKKQKKMEYERVMRVQQKTSRGTWPLMAARSGSGDAETAEDEAAKLAELKDQIDADPYHLSSAAAPSAPVASPYKYESHYDAPTSSATPSPYQYQYEFSYEAEPLPEPEEQTIPVVVAAPVVVRAAVPAPVPVALEELQQQQLMGLALHVTDDEEGSCTEGAFDLASLRTRLDSVDTTRTTLASLRSRLASEDLGQSPVVVTATEPFSLYRAEPCEIAAPACPTPIDPAFERRRLYCCVEEEADEEDDEESEEEGPRDPLAFLDTPAAHLVTHKSVDKSLLACSPPSRFAMVLSTNPPDFSSPLMRATLRMKLKQRQNRSW